jgi:hypothetical protein
MPAQPQVSGARDGGEVDVVGDGEAGDHVGDESLATVVGERLAGRRSRFPCQVPTHTLGERQRLLLLTIRSPVAEIPLARGSPTSLYNLDGHEASSCMCGALSGKGRAEKREELSFSGQRMAHILGKLLSLYLPTCRGPYSLLVNQDRI